MLRTLGKTIGGTLALLALASTLAIAQGEPMTCMADDGKGNCTAVADSSGHTMIVIGEGVKTGDKVTCQNRGYMINCETIITNNTLANDEKLTEG